MRREDQVAKALVLPRLALRDEVRPDVGGLLGVVAGARAQVEPHGVGFALLVAGERERRGDDQRIGEARVARAASHRKTEAEDRRERGLLLRIVEAVDAVAAEVMPGLVADDRRELRLALAAQEAAAPDLHHAVGRHGRVEIGTADQVDAKVAAVVARDLARDPVDVRVELRIANEELRPLELLLLLVELIPQPVLVARGLGAEARTHARLQGSCEEGAR